MIKIKHIIFLVAFSFWACSEEPVSCFDFQEEGVEVFQSIQFLNCSTDSDQFEWDFGDGNTSTDPNPIHAYSDTGLYEISLRAISEFRGSENMLTREITIENPASKFLGLYNAGFDEENYLLKIEAGNSPGTILLNFDNIFFCIATCSQYEINVDQQNYWNSNFQLIRQGSGKLDGSIIEIDFILFDEIGGEFLRTLSAEKIDL